jgi:hypothetical protein
MRHPILILALLAILLNCEACIAQNDNPPPTLPTDQQGAPPIPRMDGQTPPPRNDRPPKGQRQGLDQNKPKRDDGQKYSLEQAISDNAQLHTIAFSGLAFLTGSFGCDTFLPPGKVSDYFGFQYMRDVQPNGMGHNTDFLTRIANNMLYILTDEQKAQLIALGKAQETQVRALALKRFPLIKAFCRQLDGDVPTGSTGLDKTAVMKYTAEIFTMDGQLAYDRAIVCGKILANLSDDQKTYLAKLKFADYTTWPEMAEPLDKRTLSHDAFVMMMTYASEMFSWYAGSIEADTYFCPERHGTYFGGFYMKDAPAMGQRNYTISTSLTGDSGEQFLQTLTETQRKLITEIPNLQRKDLTEISATRRAISTELRKALNGEIIDKAKVLALSKRYGELDGELSHAGRHLQKKAHRLVTPERFLQLYLHHRLGEIRELALHFFQDRNYSLEASLRVGEGESQFLACFGNLHHECLVESTCFRARHGSLELSEHRHLFLHRYERRRSNRADVLYCLCHLRAGSLEYADRLRECSGEHPRPVHVGHLHHHRLENTVGGRKGLDHLLGGGFRCLPSESRHCRKGTDRRIGKTGESRLYIIRGADELGFARTGPLVGERFGCIFHCPEVLYAN